MASLSFPAPVHGGLNSPFDSLPDTPLAIPSSVHHRKHSRNPSAAPLPSFSFNPGAPVAVADVGLEKEAEPAKEMAVPEPRKRGPRPPPLPEFKFNPGADAPSEPPPSPTHPILEEMAQNTHRNSRSARPAPLAAFTFGAATSNPSSPSPTKSTFENAPISARAHRRGGSEFVGGGAEGTQLVSTSPQRLDTRPLGPPVTGFNPRGHAHRRSQAISISEIDTSELIKASALGKHRTGSTPTTPSDIPRMQLFSQSHTSSPQKHQSMSQPPASSSSSSSSSTRRRGSAPGVRPRVGFSDHVDVIPRPLSLISSDTEGSCSTIRGLHSVSGSINSIAASPTPFPTSPPILRFEDASSPRPHTADPVGFFSGHNFEKSENLHAGMPKRPLSSGSPAFTPSGSPPLKKKSWFSHSNDGSPTPTPRLERSDLMSAFASFSPADPADLARPKTSPERSASIKKRKTRSWTGGIFSKKSRHRASKSKPKRIPTPPVLLRRDTNEIFDAEDTIVIREPSPVHTRPITSVQPMAATESMPSSYSAPEDRMTSPIIDLDAALGPFGSEERFNADAGRRGAAARIAKLHSSERRGVTDAFGAFHRRAESAPQMPPVSRSTFGVHHEGSNASLVEDVFDEEEEDNFLAGKTSEDGFSLNTEMDVVAEQSPEPKEMEAIETDLAKPSSGDGLGLSMAAPAPDAVVIVDADEPVVDPARASNSTIEAPAVGPHDLDKRPASSPIHFAYPTPQTHYASSTEGQTTSNSLISSLDADHISFDNQPRFNRYLGEPSPDLGLRASNDDLPSLTDSLSTGYPPRFSSSANTRSSVEQRSASVSGPTTTRPRSAHAWKRASLASLNRLIPGSSNGSKLKFETMPDPAEEEKARKKGNRLSKLMHFWRSKEKTGN